MSITREFHTNFITQENPFLEKMVAKPIAHPPFFKRILGRGGQKGQFNTKTLEKDPFFRNKQDLLIFLEKSTKMTIFPK